MGISVAIATHNRASELERTLRSLRGLDPTAEQFEILVIDNRSEDGTESVVRSIEDNFDGRLRYVYEGRLGLSHARNRAVEEARHEIVAFLDDDVDVDPGWLRAISDAYRAADIAAVGGKAYLIYPRNRPGWLGEREEGLLTKVDLGPESRPAEPDELYGLNLSIRKDVFEQVGLFRTDLGRVGRCLLSSEEEDLLSRIAQAGGRLLYEPRAVVGHRVAPERLRRRWFWSRIYWGCRGAARMAPDSLISVRQLLRSTWHVGLATWQSARAAATHGPASEESFHRTMTLVGKAGYWAGLSIRITSRLRNRAGPRMPLVPAPPRERGARASPALASSPIAGLNDPLASTRN